MRAVIQRVTHASVAVESGQKASIGEGLLVLLGVEGEDSEADGEWLSNKIVSLRIFPDEEGKMNRSLQDVDGELLIISQFTLHGNARKGTRPSFVRAAAPEHSEPMYEDFVSRCEGLIGKENVGTGEFGAMMQVELCNEGPVTLILDTKQKKF